MSLSENQQQSNLQNQQQLLLKKKGLLSKDQTQTNVIRTSIKKIEQQFKESKPFSKKYGNQNTTTKTNKDITPLSKQNNEYKTKSQKQIDVQNNKLSTVEQKQSTKQTFHKRLTNNIIKDQEQPTPNSKQSFRIKKVDNRSPKKVRDDLILINQQQGRLQKQIFELHKSNKTQIDRIKSIYHISERKISSILSQFKDNEGKQINWQETINLQLIAVKLDLLYKSKSKSLARHQHKINNNAYIQYLLTLQQDIQEMPSSEEEDLVDELPPDRPKLEANMGSYSITMSNIKQKNYALNLRRTYQVFKQEDKQYVQFDKNISKAQQKQQVVKQQGENRLTLNQKFKDFLLN